MKVIQDIEGTPALVDLLTGEVLQIPFFKTPHNHNRNIESDRTATRCEDPSLTDQSFKDEVDINVIVERALKGQEVPIVLPEHFGIDDRPTYLEIQERMAENAKTFYNLDPETRYEFQNNPARWMDQVRKDLDAGNLDNLARMGIDIGDLEVRSYKAPPTTAQAGTPAPGPLEEAGTPVPAKTTPPGSE